ncbi:hypothetical protein [Planctopirus hydrillae]|nr:hypothetical protein [Planctopirus hydrillae]
MLAALGKHAFFNQHDDVISQESYLFNCLSKTLARVLAGEGGTKCRVRV